MGAYIDLTGKRFGRLTVLNGEGHDASHLLLWRCRCDCGKIIITRGQDLRRGASKSCGCLKLEQLKERSQKHSMAGSRPYRIWKNMKTRCYNQKTKTYADYGARGIKICERWKNSFENFWADMGPTYAPRLSIDRKDVNGDYCPENCRWADKKTQNRNTRANHFIDSPFGRMTIAELAEKTGIRYDTLKRRIYRGPKGGNLMRSS